MGVFSDKIVVITGATSGIGAATSEAFAKDGALVVVVGRNHTKADNLVNRIKAQGGNAVFIKCDVTVPADVKALSSVIENDYGHVDVLFNNAGIMLDSKELERLPVEEWERTFSTNVDSIFYVTAALKHLIFKVQGCIINNASIAGMQSYIAGRSYAYSASKAAVIQFTRQMAVNYAKDAGVRVNCICPGIIDTPILGDRDRKIYARRVPLGYVGNPKEVADTVKFLASDEASYITGAVIPIDGGGSLDNRYGYFEVFETYIARRFLKLNCWKNIRKSRVLVTGGTGFVGFYIVCILISMNDKLHLGNEIIIHGRKLSKFKELYGNVLERNDVKYYISNIDEKQIFVGDRIDYIIHAAMPSDSLKDLDPVSILDIGIKGTENIVKLALKHKVKSLVYLSSVTIYGDITDKVNIDESYCDKQDWRNDNDAYMLGKRGAEFVLFSKFRNSGLPVKVLRVGYVYGANPMKDSRVYNSFIADAAHGNSIQLKSDGLLKRPLVYVLDVVKAIFLALDSVNEGGAFNVTGPDMSLREFGSVCTQKKDEKVSDNLNSDEIHIETISTKKAEEILKWDCEQDHVENIIEAIWIKRLMIGS